MPISYFFYLPSALNHSIPMFKICIVLKLLFLRKFCGSVC